MPVLARAVTHPAALIGPNALIQTVRALHELVGPSATFAVLARADRLDLLDQSPGEMVHAAEFTALVDALFATLPRSDATRVLFRSGELTAAYVIRNRIPAPIRLLLRGLPPSFALRLLLRAIRRHSYTFAGAAQFHYELRPTPLITLTGDPATGTLPASRVEDYYHGAFSTFMRTLVTHKARVDMRTSTTGSNLFWVRW
jgi:divinyl protochlorophyllide a 8-vinyl-reductase